MSDPALHVSELSQKVVGRWLQTLTIAQVLSLAGNILYQELEGKDETELLEMLHEFQSTAYPVPENDEGAPTGESDPTTPLEQG